MHVIEHCPRSRVKGSEGQPAEGLGLLFLAKKVGRLLQGYFPLGDGRIYHAGYLTSADEKVPD